MKIKSIVSLALALAIASAVAMPAFAEAVAKAPKPGSGSIEIAPADPVKPVDPEEPDPDPENPDPDPPPIIPNNPDYNAFASFNNLNFGEHKISGQISVYDTVAATTEKKKTFLAVVMDNGPKTNYTLCLELGRFTSGGVNTMAGATLALNAPTAKKSSAGINDAADIKAPTVVLESLDTPKARLVMETVQPMAAVRWDPTLTILGDSVDAAQVGTAQATLTWGFVAAP